MSSTPCLQEASEVSLLQGALTHHCPGSALAPHKGLKQVQRSPVPSSSLLQQAARPPSPHAPPSAAALCGRCWKLGKESLTPSSSLAAVSASPAPGAVAQGKPAGQRLSALRQRRQGQEALPLRPFLPSTGPCSRVQRAVLPTQSCSQGHTVPHPLSQQLLHTAAAK